MKKTNRIIAINPGANVTGIVVANRSKNGHLLHSQHYLIKRPKTLDYQSPAGLDKWVNYIQAVVDKIITPKSRVAVESINAYAFKGNQALATRISFIEGAYVAGNLIGKYGAMSIPSFGHGKNPLHWYPAPLIGEGEVAGEGQLKHCRAAWDVAKIASSAIS